MGKARAKLRELCAIDIRSLACFRIGLALIVLVDLFVRLQDLTAHYTDEGVLPRSVLLDQVMHPWHFSLHLISGTWQVQLILFVVAIVAAIALLVGYRTRLATAVSWLLLISVQSRNPAILQGGDVFLRLLLFWALFLPLGACWSLDRTLQRIKPIGNQIVSAATVGLLLQVCFVYWFSAILKSDASWTRHGTAIWYALSIGQFSTPLGLYLLNFPTLLKVATFATLYLEAFGPFLAFSPIWTATLRTAVVAIFVLFHLLGLELTMELAHFCYVCAVAWIVFLPTAFWDKLLKSSASGPRAWAPRAWRPSRFSNAAALFFLGYILLWNVRSLGIAVPFLGDQTNPTASLLRIDQYWNMFAPYPLKEDGWYVIPAQLRDGTEVDLFTAGGPVTWEKPALISATYPNDHWRSYMINFREDEQAQLHLLHYARYLTVQWNESHPFDKQLVTFDIAFMSRCNRWAQPAAPYRKLTLWEHQCFAGQN